MMKENDLKTQKSNNISDLLSCCPCNEENFAFLLRLIRRNVVIPFLGAGISANFNYPLWKNFLVDQAEKHNLPDVKTALNNHEYEKAAGILKEKLGGSMECILMQNFGDHVYKASDGSREIEELPRIFSNLILTTNFDEVIEMLYAKVNGEYIEKLTPELLKDVKVSYKRIACGEPTLVKLHGDVATREFVLTEQEYDAVYGKRVLDVRLPLPSFLRDILLSRIILFMGCSLEDDRTLRVIEQSQIDGSISFALLPLPCETENEDNPWKPQLKEEKEGKEVEINSFSLRKRFLYEHNIIPIWYPYEYHDALKIFLKAIADQVGSEHNLSTTVIRNKVNEWLYDGDRLKKKGEISQAFYYYTKAEKNIKEHTEAFTIEDRLNDLGRIKKFYDTNGYALECMKIIKDIIQLTEQKYSHASVELAMRYHDIGYVYERYQYYELMLKAMLRSREILQEYREKAGEDKDFYNYAAFIYISLGYAYLKNSSEEKAKEHYREAEELYNRYGNCLDPKHKAFLCNGLYRYYDLQGQKEEALQKLDLALELRRELYNEGNELMTAQHLINTHSNKIYIYLKENQFEKAEEEFEACMEDSRDIWDIKTKYPDAKCRILTDHGDIFAKKQEYLAAYNEYKRALEYRKYLHYFEDLITAGLYKKMAESLENVLDMEDKALEYLIQAYVIYKKITGDTSNITKDARDCVYRLGEKFSYRTERLEQHVDVQQEFFDFRCDESTERREEDLIRFFEL